MKTRRGYEHLAPLARRRDRPRYCHAKQRSAALRSRNGESLSPLVPIPFCLPLFHHFRLPASYYNDGGLYEKMQRL
jgi:hypothetical protein